MSKLKHIKNLKVGDIVMNEYDELAEITEIEEPGLFRCVNAREEPNVIDIRELERSKDPDENKIEIFNRKEFERAQEDNESDW